MPLAFDQIVSILSLAIAGISLVAGMWRNGKAESARDQLIADKLDRLGDITSETRDTLNTMDAKLDDVKERTTKLEERVDTLFRRLERVERYQDTVFRNGGTD